uniref:(California timema) hypothetical protein n=1 Tax=Timema californicum TaxID=61474 RepID=A0A7R9JCP2_TIMCA|nr:unnamed protein product [Timema californicum]
MVNAVAGIEDAVLAARCTSVCWKPGKINSTCVSLCASTPVVKPGHCPDAESLTVFDTVCLDACSQDSGCPQTHKCCRHDCGATCQEAQGLRTVPGLPDIPSNITVMERRRGRVVSIHWLGQETPGLLYLLEQRQHVGHHFSQDRLGPWMSSHRSSRPSATLKGALKPGRWYEFRAAAVSANGTRGFSEPSQPFTLSIGPKPPGPPEDLTVQSRPNGNGTYWGLLKWKHPRNSDLPVQKYKVFWSRRFQEKAAASVLIVLNNLQAHSLYFLQVQALAQFGRDRLKGEKAATFLDTAIHPTKIRTLISPSSAVELNTTSASANCAIEAAQLSKDELNSSGTAMGAMTDILEGNSTSLQEKSSISSERTNLKFCLLISCEVFWWMFACLVPQDNKNIKLKKELYAKALSHLGSNTTDSQDNRNDIAKRIEWFVQGITSDRVSVKRWIQRGDKVVDSRAQLFSCRSQAIQFSDVIGRITISSGRNQTGVAYEKSFFLKNLANGLNVIPRQFLELVASLPDTSVTTMIVEQVLGSQDDPQVTVTIPQGTLRGASQTTVSGTVYHRFLGIPYAKPPVGNLRFKSPQPPENWNGTRDALEFGSNCRQEGGIGEEDCLFINIFTPQLPNNSADTELLPVMVWFHWGAFVTGNGDITPGHLIDKHVLFVPVNYRVNVFGFLSLQGADVSGNAGLKDQVAALRWVKNNIAHFGGDPDSVTIFGGSAGGASVHYHVLSPLSSGLFHRAISESGSALNPWAFTPDTQSYAFRLGSNLGLETDSAQELADFLRTVPGEQLSEAVDTLLTKEETVKLLTYPFLPTLEYPVEGESVFLTDYPHNVATSGKFNKVPYITGICLLEGHQFIGSDEDLANSSFWEAIMDNLELVVPTDLGLPAGSPASIEVANKVKKFYFGYEDISLETKSKWIDLQTDLLFAIGTQTTIHIQSKFSNATYNYQFVFGTPYHIAEVYYLIYSEAVEGVNTEPAIMSRLMTDLWSSFAKTGIPSATNVTWPPASGSSYPYLKLDTEHQLLNKVEKDRMDFWAGIYKDYYNGSIDA